ncbi:MAG: peptidylprolyl isomerase [Chlamydiota bacterium]
MKITAPLLAILLSLGLMLSSVASATASQPKITVNNRVLAKINGTPITMMDVVKQMDIFFHHNFPEYKDSFQARFQFYSTNWQHFLQELIDRELIIADAQEKKMEIADGDIRQELEGNFGPNVAETIDSLGMTYQEAWRLVKSDIILRRMMMYMVNSKAFNQVSPREIRHAYREYKEQTLKNDQWRYQVITIRSSDAEHGKVIASEAYRLLNEESISPKKLTELLRENDLLHETDKLSVSHKFKHASDTLSEAYRQVLSGMQPSSYSQPIGQTSRNNQLVYRIFYLDGYQAPQVAPLKEVEENIKEKMVDKATNDEANKYLTKLRKRFHVDNQHLAEMIPPNYEPFTII